RPANRIVVAVRMATARPFARGSATDATSARVLGSGRGRVQCLGRARGLLRAAPAPAALHPLHRVELPPWHHGAGARGPQRGRTDLPAGALDLHDRPAATGGGADL